MKNKALLFLTFGALLMFMGLVMAVSATPDQAPYRLNLSFYEDSNACLQCHNDAHEDWTPPTSLRVIQVPFELIPTPQLVVEQPYLCSNCHEVEGDPDALPEEVEARIESTRSRVETLRSGLETIRQARPEWVSDAYHADKSAAQRKAERIETLITFVEADGSWGFHHPSYTDDILTEAESLMDELNHVLEL